jgi:hypothetical protein
MYICTVNPTIYYSKPNHKGTHPRNITFMKKKAKPSAKAATKATGKSLDPRVLAIGEKLKKLRIKKGYPAYDYFAFEHNISRVLYWRMEKGTNFTIGSFLKVLNAHDLTMKEFFKDIK